MIEPMTLICTGRAFFWMLYTRIGNVFASVPSVTQVWQGSLSFITQRFPEIAMPVVAVTNVLLISASC